MAVKLVRCRRTFRLTNAQRPIKSRDLKRVGDMFAERIVSRTQSGRDSDGHPFRRYSPAYARRIGKSSVDLTQSGDMMRQVGVVNSSEGGLTFVTLGLRSASALRKAQGHHFGQGGRLPIRRFMRVSQSWVKDALLILRGALKLDVSDR